MQLAAGALLSQRWEVGRELGQGACATVFEVVRDALGREREHVLVAKVAELPPVAAAAGGGKKKRKTKAQAEALRKANTLYYENSLYQGALKGLRMIPYCPPSAYGDDTRLGVRFLILQRLGEDLGRRVQRAPGGVLAPPDVAALGVQIVDGVEEMHVRGYLLVDVKPDNFMTGRAEDGEEDTVFLVDLGLLERYMEAHTGLHRPEGPARGPNAAVGTPLFRSRNMDAGCMASLRDDVEAILHMFVFMLGGSLPWADAKSNAAVQRIKQSTSRADLVEGLPGEDCLLNMFDHVDGLEYIDRPDYDLLRAELLQLSEAAPATTASASSSSSAGKRPRRTSRGSSTSASSAAAATGGRESTRAGRAGKKKATATAATKQKKKAGQSSAKHPASAALDRRRRLQQTSQTPLLVSEDHKQPRYRDEKAPSNRVSLDSVPECMFLTEDEEEEEEAELEDGAEEAADDGEAELSDSDVVVVDSYDEDSEFEMSEENLAPASRNAGRGRSRPRRAAAEASLARNSKGAGSQRGSGAATTARTGGGSKTVKKKPKQHQQKTAIKKKTLTARRRGSSQSTSTRTPHNAALQVRDDSTSEEAEADLSNEKEEEEEEAELNVFEPVSETRGSIASRTRKRRSREPDDEDAQEGEDDEEGFESPLSREPSPLWSQDSAEASGGGGRRSGRRRRLTIGLAAQEDLRRKSRRVQSNGDESLEEEDDLPKLVLQVVDPDTDLGGSSSSSSSASSARKQRRRSRARSLAGEQIWAVPPDGVFTIGRFDEDNDHQVDLQLEDGTVSRCHAQAWMDQEAVSGAHTLLVRDWSSSNGTKLSSNGYSVSVGTKVACRVFPGQRLTLGDTTLVLRLRRNSDLGKSVPCGVPL